MRAVFVKLGNKVRRRDDKLPCSLANVPRQCTRRPGAGGVVLLYEPNLIQKSSWVRNFLFSFSFSVDDCQKLWKRLRDRYTWELKALEMASRSGSPFVSKQSWEFAKSMEFYKNCGRPRK